MIKLILIFIISCVGLSAQEDCVQFVNRFENNKIKSMIPCKPYLSMDTAHHSSYKIYIRKDSTINENFYTTGYSLECFMDTGFFFLPIFVVEFYGGQKYKVEVSYMSDDLAYITAPVPKDILTKLGNYPIKSVYVEQYYVDKLPSFLITNNNNYFQEFLTKH